MFFYKIFVVCPINVIFFEPFFLISYPVRDDNGIMSYLLAPNKPQTHTKHKHNRKNNLSQFFNRFHFPSPFFTVVLSHSIGFHKNYQSLRVRKICKIIPLHFKPKILTVKIQHIFFGNFFRHR